MIITENAPVVVEGARTGELASGHCHRARQGSRPRRRTQRRRRLLFLTADRAASRTPAGHQAGLRQDLRQVVGVARPRTVQRSSPVGHGRRPRS